MDRFGEQPIACKGPFRLSRVLAGMALCWGVVAPTGAAGQSAGEEPLFEVYRIYEESIRFPSVVVTTNGAVLAFRGQDSVLQVRRSEDGGATWGSVIDVSETPGTMGAAVVDETSGDVMVFDHFVKPGYTMYRSRDDGVTWRRETVEIHPDGFGGVGSTHGADSGITLRHGEHAGRLVLAARVFGPADDNGRAWWPYHYNSAIYSDDGGSVWHTSAPFPVLGTGEGAVAELSDGRIYYNSRMHMAEDALRRHAWSYDGGAVWRDPGVAEDLPDGPRGTSYGCMGALTIAWHDGQEVLIYSNLDEETDDRRRITVWASTDGGLTWPHKRLVDGGPSAYSSLATGREGTASEGFIYLLYEGAPEGRYAGMHVARFNMAWILEGGGAAPE